MSKIQLKLLKFETNHSLKLFGVRLLSGIFGKKTPKRTWLCAGISLVRYVLQTR